MWNPFRIFGQVLAAPFKAVHSAVTGTHANWWALISIVVAIIIGIITIKLTSGPASRPAAENQSVPSLGETYNLAMDAPSGTPAAGIRTEEGKASAGDCESAYAQEKEDQFRELIEAEVGKCVRITEKAIKLYFGCRADAANRDIVLKYQVSDALENHVVRMSATYSGPKEVDLSQVEIRSLNQGLEDACRQKNRSTR